MRLAVSSRSRPLEHLDREHKIAGQSNQWSLGLPQVYVRRSCSCRVKAWLETTAISALHHVLLVKNITQVSQCTKRYHHPSSSSSSSSSYSAGPVIDLTCAPFLSMADESATWNTRLSSMHGCFTSESVVWFPHTGCSCGSKQATEDALFFFVHEVVLVMIDRWIGVNESRSCICW